MADKTAKSMASLFLSLNSLKIMLFKTYNSRFQRKKRHSCSQATALLLL